MCFMSSECFLLALLKVALVQIVSAAVHLVCFLGICLVSRSQLWGVDGLVNHEGLQQVGTCESTFGLELARLVKEGGRVGQAVVGHSCGRI